MTVNADVFMTFWFGVGAASHLFWWWQMNALRSGVGWCLCLLTIFPAALLGFITFPFEAWLHWLTGPHSSDKGTQP